MKLLYAPLSIYTHDASSRTGRRAWYFIARFTTNYKHKVFPIRVWLNVGVLYVWLAMAGYAKEVYIDI